MRNITKLNLIAALISGVFLYATTVQAAPQITLLKSRNNNINISKTAIETIINNYVDISQYRSVKAQVMTDSHNQTYILVYLFSKKYHKFDVIKISLDSRLRATAIIQNYKMTDQDFAQQPGITPAEAVCPNKSVQFISFAPNDDDFELGIAKAVANYAEKHKLKTVRLFVNKATRTNYLNYMACPKLVGNFYDGDANTESITTADGEISYGDIHDLLNKQFRYKVTNIWLACEAFNDPMKTTMLDTAESQKYAAGINDLLVGPSDKAAACAMKAAIDGKPMTAAFQDCYNQFDDKDDIWGFEGAGSDYFGA